MSTESIYNLIPQPEPVIEKSRLHKSKYSPHIPPTYSTFTGSNIPSVNNVDDHIENTLSHSNTNRLNTHSNSTGGSSGKNIVNTTTPSSSNNKPSHKQFGPKEGHISNPLNYLKK